MRWSEGERVRVDSISRCVKIIMIMLFNLVSVNYNYQYVLISLPPFKASSVVLLSKNNVNLIINHLVVSAETGIINIVFVCKT